MGNCCFINQNDRHAGVISKDEIESWYLKNRNFDISNYHRHFSTYDYLSFQSIISLNWKDIDLPIPVRRSSTKPRINTECINEFYPLILEGTPNHKIRDLILNIFEFEDSSAQREYSEICKLFEEAQTYIADSLLEPLIGRKSISNLFLTKLGDHVCKRLLYIISKTQRNVEICLILPPLVQIMLWFLEDYEIFQVVRLLIANKLLPINAEEHQDLVRNQKKNIQLFQDIVLNMAVGYIQPCYYPQVLCFFISDGLQALRKIAKTIIDLNSRYVEFTNKSQDLIQLFKKVSLKRTKMFKIIMKFPEINLGEDNENDFEIPFQGDSVLIDSHQKLIELLSLLPSCYSLFQMRKINIRFEELINRKFIAFLVIVRTNYGKTIGLFLDRSISSLYKCKRSLSRIIELESMEAFSHVLDKEITALADQGLVLLDQSGNLVLEIDSEFEHIYSLASSTFGSIQILNSYEQGIHHIEMFEFI